ncbi:MAG TPA: hypothetical protein VM510_10615 [Caulifigura sp.]|jgi:hypothetical protein|nr:hypothetical protein [Caulifigura sp.]
MVDIVLTSEQIRAIRNASGAVRFLSPGREVICISNVSSSREAETPFEASGDCQPLTVDQIEELARRIADPDAEFITTEELLSRLEQRRAS